jgi:hypothetical protein
LQLSQLKQHSAVAEAEVQHIRSTSATLQQRQRPLAHVGTTTDAAASAPDDRATDPTGSNRQAEGSAAAAAADPGHLAPINSGGSPGAEAAATSAAHGHSASSDGPEAEEPGAEVVELRQRLQEAESQATALRAQLRQLRSDHEATCAELEEARGVVRELRESVR